MNDPLRLPCPTCSGTRSTTTGDRHADTKMDICATCHDEGTIPARPGETPEASYQPVRGADAKLQQALADFIGLGLPLCSSRDMAIHFLGPPSPLASLVAERDAALAELERVLDPEMKDLHLANGGIDMAVAGPMVERLAVAMTGWFRQSGAENYIEMGLNARTEPFERYCVTVQRYGALSPHQLRQAAEDRASSAEAERDAARELAGLTWTVPDVDAWGRFADEKGATGIRDRLNRLFRRAVTAEERVRQLQNDTDREGQDAQSAVPASRSGDAVERGLTKAMQSVLRERDRWADPRFAYPDSRHVYLTLGEVRSLALAYEASVPAAAPAAGGGQGAG